MKTRGIKKKKEEKNKTNDEKHSSVIKVKRSISKGNEKRRIVSSIRIVRLRKDEKKCDIIPVHIHLRNSITSMETTRSY